MRFEKGQPIYLIEVMKMFHIICASFSGTIDRVIMQGGDSSIVQNWHPPLKITPAEKLVEVNAVEIERQTRTRAN